MDKPLIEKNTIDDMTALALPNVPNTFSTFSKAVFYSMDVAIWFVSTPLSNIII